MVVVPSAALLLLVAVFAYIGRTSGGLYDQARFATGAREASASLQIALLEDESAARGYAISGKTAFLSQLNRAPKLAAISFAYLDRVAASDPAQAAAVAQMELLARDKLAGGQAVISLVDRHRAAQARRRVATGRGLGIMNRFRDVRSVYDAREALVTANVRDKIDRIRDVGFSVVLVLGLFSVAFTTVVSYIVGRQLVRRIERVAAHARGYAAGERVEERLLGGDEVAVLDGALHDMAQMLDERQRSVHDALEAATEASRLKSQFVATVSHEIRTPMNGVIGMTELLLDTELTAAQREHAVVVRDSAEALMFVINDILDFSKIEAGYLQLDNADFALLDLVESIASLAVSAARVKGVVLMTYVDPAIPATVHGDGVRLRQVLLNLVGNAVKFTESGSVTISVTRESGDESGVTIAFSVKDTGIGIAPEMHQLLFQPFRQADASPKRRFGGTGLGLAISQKLVALMGGTITVRSALGAGSTFAFTIRFTRVRGASHAVRMRRLDGLRVLVLDDEPTSREVLSRHVAGWGMRSAVAADGAEAMEYLDRSVMDGEPFDLAIVDLMMPAMDGFGFAQLVRANPALARLPMILVTAFDLSGRDAAALAAGFDAYLVKPIRQAHLFELVSSLAFPSDAHGPPATPLLPAPATEAAIAPYGDVPQPAPVGAERRLERILVVEDNIVNQRVALKQLEKLGFVASAVVNGAEALALLRDESFDLVLMDCQMPVMDGFEATAAIRAAEATTAAHLPIVALTANARPEDRERCLAAGMDDYLAKPVSVAELSKTLERWLKTRNADAV
jgi:signal transduction histidine kinase/DNA-binding response OmpR family regulator